MLVRPCTTLLARQARAVHCLNLHHPCSAVLLARPLPPATHQLASHSHQQQSFHSLSSQHSAPSPPQRHSHSARVHSKHWSSSEESNAEYQAPRDRQIEAAKASALGSLNYRLHARVELAKKLTDKGHDPELVSEALDQLEESGVLKDSDYAEAYARGKWRQSRWAPSRIRSELLRKGLTLEAADQGLRHVFGSSARNTHFGLQKEVDEAEGELEDEGSSEAMLTELVEATRRQASFTRGLPVETRRRRLSAWLQRRGHSWATISQLLQRLSV